MISTDELTSLISGSMTAHEGKAKKPSGAVRKWDGKTPYGVHPALCAMLLLQDTAVPEFLRISGARALLFHDVKEDTTAALPLSFTPFEVGLVDQMTFESSDREMEEIWSRPVWIKLLKLYDKVSNLLDGVWMSTEKRAKYCAYVKKLTIEVEAEYGNLNITKIARAIAI